MGEQGKAEFVADWLDLRCDPDRDGRSCGRAAGRFNQAAHVAFAIGKDAQECRHLLNGVHLLARVVG